ncbi:MAG: PHP domain-containing protein, partial [Clostridia bacterium]|nr:PHP domain-containing protein [Clostridia bacterium]
MPQPWRELIDIDTIENLHCTLSGRQALVTVDASALLTATQEKDLLTAMRRAMPGLAVTLRPRYARLGEGFLQDPAPYKETVIGVIEHTDAATARMLQGCIWAEEGGRIVIKASDSVTSEFLINSKASNVVREAISAVFRTEASVSIAGAVPVSPAPKPQSSPKADTSLFGKPIKDAPTPIADINDASGTVTVRGECFRFEPKPLKNPRGKNNTILLGDVTDGVSSISVKAFCEKDTADKLAEAIKNGQWLTLRGRVQPDPLSGELAIQATDITPSPPPPARTDDAETKRVELHLHTKMSAQDGFIDAEALFKQAKAWGHSHVAVTDHGIVQAFPEAYEAAKKHDVSLIYGMEGYLAHEHDDRYDHITILVKDKTGLRNLYRLVTASHMEHFHKRPRLTRALLETHREGLLYGSACEAGELYQAVLHSKTEIDNIGAFYDFFEIMPNGNNAFLKKPALELQNLNKTIIALGEKL